MSIIEICVNVRTFRTITPIDCLIMLTLQNPVCFDFGQYKSEQQRVQKSNEDFQSLNILIVVKMVIFHSVELCNFFCKHFTCAVEGFNVDFARFVRNFVPSRRFMCSACKMCSKLTS